MKTITQADLDAARSEAEAARIQLTAIKAEIERKHNEPPTSDQVRSLAMRWYYAQVKECASSLLIDFKNGEYSNRDALIEATEARVESFGLHNRCLDAVCALVASNNDDCYIEDFGAEDLAGVDDAQAIYTRLAYHAFLADVRGELQEQVEAEGLKFDAPHERPCDDCADFYDLDDLKTVHVKDEQAGEDLRLCEDCIETRAQEARDEHLDNCSGCPDCEGTTAAEFAPECPICGGDHPDEGKDCRGYYPKGAEQRDAPIRQMLPEDADWLIATKERD